MRLRRASECFAVWILGELGFSVLEVNKPLILDGVEVSDIDVIAVKDGVRYAVEVKSGSADVSSVRQAYTNALLVGARPLVLARGVDEKARKVAEKLGVELIVLPDTVYCGYEDLREAVREAFYSVIDDLLEYVVSCKNLSEEDYKLLRLLAESDTIKDLADTLGTSIDEAGKTLGRLYHRGVLPRGNYRRLKTIARLKILYCTRVASKEHLDDK